jgi:hypothetical protein
VSKINDGAEIVAADAYAIYRGMVREPPQPPHWGQLTDRERGLLTWIVRFTRMQNETQ